mmetsp:Transcript_38074/g.81903  ORF Transcript_38074/g.81903 Transcript_38074/m.81903 type:complete len:90 (-) Transcript_38074:43-312(-)
MNAVKDAGADEVALLEHGSLRLGGCGVDTQPACMWLQLSSAVAAPMALTVQCTAALVLRAAWVFPSALSRVTRGSAPSGSSCNPPSLLD